MSDQLDLFGNEASGSRTDAEREESLVLELRTGAERLAEQGVYIGTSSWKYPGWCGLLYRASRYERRGRFAEARFNRECLSEYAEVFKSVCVDGAYYQFPSEQYLTGLAEQVPSDFRFSFKVTDEITLKRYPNIQRMGDRAGRENSEFLNAERFSRQFLGPLEAIRDLTGLLIFEFSRFSPADFRHQHEFLDSLDRFLGKLPKGWDYGVEIRNEEYLNVDYLAVLKRNQVGHVYNSWEAMPGVDRQIALVGDQLHDLHAGVRLLLKPGRSYRQAVDRFAPYRRVQEVSESARDAGARLIESALLKKRRLYLYGNNRLEGCSPRTLAAILQRLQGTNGRATNDAKTA